MKKRGQVTVFLIAIVVVLIIVGLFFSLANYGIKSKMEQAIAENTKLVDAGIVKAYAESCLKMASEDALFNRIGLQGGFINPAGDAYYKESGIESSPISPSSVVFAEKVVPFYLEASSCDRICTGYNQANPPECTAYHCRWSYNYYIPDPTQFLDSISKKISDYAEVEFQKCFDKNTFKDIDILISGDQNKLKAQATINEEDVTVHLDYPLTIKTGSAESNLNSFEINLPIRLKKLYQASVKIIENMNKTADTPELAMVLYYMAPDCNDYDKNGLTNVYVRHLAGNTDIVQFSDFSTYFKNYFKTYTFQIAVKNVNIIGDCVGVN